MKNLFKFVLAALCAFAFSASAQCITDPRVGRAPVVAGSGGNPCAPWGTPQPTGPAYYGGGYGSGTSVQYYNQNAHNGGYGGQPLLAVGSQYNGEVVVGYRYERITRPCYPHEMNARTRRAAVMGGIGGAIGGHLHEDNRNSVGRGLLIGAGTLGLLSELGEMTGLVPCEKEEMVRVPVTAPRQVASVNTNSLQQAAYNTAPVTREVASRCAINGKVWRGLSESQCDELALELSKTKTVVAQNTAPQTETTPKSAPAKSATFWGWFNPRSSESNPLTCFATKQISGMPPRCASVIVEPSQDGETENAWRERVKTLAMK